MCPTLIALVHIAGCPTLNGLTPYSWVSYSECPTPYSRCPTLNALLHVGVPSPYRYYMAIWSPALYKNPTPAGAILCIWGLKEIEDWGTSLYFVLRFKENSMQSMSALVMKGILKALFSFIPWLLNFSDLPNYGSNSRKRYTLRLLSKCLVRSTLLPIGGKVPQPFDTLFDSLRWAPFSLALHLCSS